MRSQVIADVDVPIHRRVHMLTEAQNDPWQTCGETWRQNSLPSKVDSRYGDTGTLVNPFLRVTN